MERFKRRFSIDAPIPYSGDRRKSEPVVFANSDYDRQRTAAVPSRRYSTSVNTPVSSLHGNAQTDKHRKYSSNQEVRVQ